MAGRHVIAVDLGADSGRVIRVTLDDRGLHMEDVHRFPNVPSLAAGTLYWDVLRLWSEIRVGVDAALAGASSVGIDTWGVDFALLDRDGRLVSNPVHYRDERTNGMMEWVFERVPRRTVFERTGIQFMQINGLYQLASLIRADSPQLKIATTFVTIADLFNYWLSGYKACEFTHATTQQMYNPQTGGWDTETLAALGAPLDIFPEIVPSGTRVGEYRGVAVVLPGCHDTASAVVAVPTMSADYAYISSGTWSLVGLELPEAIINDASYAANLTNEGGVGGTFRLLKNVTGMWLAQQCRAAWREAGTEYDYDTLAGMARSADPFVSFVDVDDPLFLPPGGMPDRIREFCRRTGQVVPENDAQIMRTIYESLAMKYRYTLEKLINLTGRKVERVHIVGGGSKNALLCQMTADVSNRVVVAGPAEATALGNAVAQLIALGEFSSVGQAREMLHRTEATSIYEPANVDRWEEAYQRFVPLVGTN